VKSTRQEIGFQRQGIYFPHPDTPYFVKSITRLPSVGQEPIVQLQGVEFGDWQNQVSITNGFNISTTRKPTIFYINPILSIYTSAETPLLHTRLKTLT
jgi:hypothetical protein